MGTLIRNGRVIDPASGKDGIYDILVEDGMIAGVDASIPKGDNDIIDAAGCFVMPGLVDLHVHFREPGFEYKETIKTGSMAAAHGGVTTVFPMPNTKPVIDSVDMYDKVQTIIDRDAVVNVHQVASVTLRQQGETPVDVAALKKAGCIAISEDGKSVMNSQVYREAMKAAADEDVLVMAHCEDKNLVNGGALNEGVASRRYHVNGITNAVEDVIVARDILLSKETGCRLHLCHCSTEGVAKMMEIVKEEGLDNITAEVCPHHFILTSDDIKCDDPNYKMNPPLRTKKDVDALIRGLKDGSFKVISTDHAPHAVPEKTGSIRNAAFGIVGIETSFALSYTALVETGILTISQLIEKMSWNPAQILGSDRGTLQKGHPADIVIADIDHEYKIDKNEFASKGRNTPFDGWKVKGKILYTICDGKVVYQNA